MYPQIENWMVVDEAWNEVEYRVPKKNYLERQRDEYDRIEIDDDTHFPRSVEEVTE